MEPLAWLLAGSSATYAAWWLRAARARRVERAAELRGVRRGAEVDVAMLGEQLRRLDEAVAGRPLDAVARADYQRALDAYERAARDAARLRDPEAVRELVDTLGVGRHAVACVEAAARGHARPEPSDSCFFNPQHATAVTRVEWTPPGRATRMLPACRQCATRLAAGAALDVRTVTVGSRTAPYWELCAHRLPLEDVGVTRASATRPGIGWIWDTALSGDVDLGHYLAGGPRTRPHHAHA